MTKQKMGGLPRTILLAVGLLLIGSTSASAYVDSWITLKAKLALYATTSVPAAEVHVDTVNGIVTLHGKVFKESEKTMAAEAVRALDGVSSVRNFLQVVPDVRRMVERSDESLREGLESGFADDWGLETIEVGSVSDGTVVLEGEVNNLAEAVRATELTSNYPGVSSVKSNIRIGNDDVDSWERVDRRAAAMEGAVADGWMTTAVKTRLLANPDVPALDVNVDTRDGVVTLFGVVSTDEAKRVAAVEARLVDDVRDVRNLIQVVAEPRLEIVNEQDETITARLQHMLEQKGIASHTNFEVANGMVRLTGITQSESDRLQAAYWVRGVEGVKAVKNDLIVQESASSTDSARAR